MLKKITIVIGTLLVVSVLALYVVGNVFAQAPTPASTATPQTPLGNAWGQVCNGAGVVTNAIAKLFGMTPQDLYSEHSAGKTLSDIAKEKGVTDQQVIDAMLAGRREVVTQAVAEGRITQAQADWMLAQMKTMAPAMLNNAGMGRMGAGGHGPMGRGTPPWVSATLANP